MKPLPKPSQVQRPASRPGRRLVIAGVVIALVHPLATVFARRLWIADLICHFQEPALVATCLATILAIAKKRCWIAVALVALAVFQTVPLVRYSGANPVVADPSSKDRIRIVLSNVLYENFAYGDLEHLIRD